MGNNTRQCKNCTFWEKDFGMWTMTGWTGMGRNDGHCHLYPETIRKQGDSFCGNYENRYGETEEAHYV